MLVCLTEARLNPKAEIRLLAAVQVLLGKIFEVFLGLTALKK